MRINGTLVCLALVISHNGSLGAAFFVCSVLSLPPVFIMGVLLQLLLLLFFPDDDHLYYVIILLKTLIKIGVRIRERSIINLKINIVDCLLL